MFNTSVNLYKLAIALTLLLNLIVVYFLCKNRKMHNKEIFFLMLYELIGIAVGGKLYTYITLYNTPKTNFISLGMAANGCLIGTILMTFIFIKQFKKSGKEIFNIILTPVPLIYAGGKVGCFLNGCCRGMVYNGPFSVRYPYINSIKNVSYFPVQIIESITFFILFLILLKRFKNNKNNIGTTLFAGGLLKFILEFFRLSHVSKILTINQVVCIIFILVGILLIFFEKKEKAV